MAPITSRIRKAASAPSHPAAQKAAASPAVPEAPQAASPVASAPRPILEVADSQSGLIALLKVEADARSASSKRDLTFLIANETRKLCRARQVFVLTWRRGKLEAEAVSSLAAVDRSAPLIVWIEKLASEAATGIGSTAPKMVSEAIALDPVRAGDVDPAARAYPFRNLQMLPLRHRDGEMLGAIVLAREIPWAEQDMVIAHRLTASFGHAWSALLSPRRQSLWSRISRGHAAVGAAVLMALAFMPVPLSALAPAEVVARGATVVAAPIDGVIDAVVVEPNQKVQAGDVLVRLADITLKNRYEVAEREVTVADARLKQVTQLAFSDPRGMHELGIVRAELALKIAERNFARDMLGHTVISASRGGIAVFSDKRELTGKPVAVGERILEVADPNLLELRIDLPVADAITLRAGAKVVAFLDSDPLRPYAASVERSDYKARPGEGDVASFRVIAALAYDGRALPRLGVRGTAQIYGDQVPLGFYLFRRPIAAARQWTGL